MAQVFHPAANTLAKISLLLGVTLPLGIMFGASAVTRSSFNTNVHVPLDQPVPFSHEHHATELGIDCRYCHSNVEDSANATVPPTHTCMSCHSQIWTNSPLLEPVRESYRTGVPLQWNKVNAVPDFVYFNHSIHVNRGINCNICHGPVQQMMITYKGQTLFMSWCLNCHRNPEKYIGPRQDEFKIYKDYQRGIPAPTSPQDVQGWDTWNKEQAIANGEDYNPSKAQIQEGEELIKKYRMENTRKQLTDCWICHR